MPGMKVMDMPRQMAGKGAPTPTIFGVLGKTKPDSNIGVKSLGGLVADTKSGCGIPDALMKGSALHTERNISGHDATKIPGAHYAQVPYAGHFMKSVGAKL